MRLWWPESSEEARRWHAARGGIARGDLGLPREGLRACGGGLWKRICGRRQSVARLSGGGTAPVTRRRRVCRGGLPRPGEALWGVVLHGFGADEGVHRTGLDGGVRGGGERRSQRAPSDLHGEKRCVSLREGR